MNNSAPRNPNYLPVRACPEKFNIDFLSQFFSGFLHMYIDFEKSLDQRLYNQRSSLKGQLQKELEMTLSTNLAPWADLHMKPPCTKGHKSLIQ